MKQDKFKELKPLIEIGWGDELKVYEENGKNVIIKVQSIDKFSNYSIIYDGEYYYLIDSKDNFVNKSKNKEELIPDGFAKAV